VIEWDEIANQSVFGAICFVAGWIVTSIKSLRKRVDKHRKDLRAAFTKIRDIENRLNRGEYDNGALSRKASTRQDSDESASKADNL
jgi:hypothetical protein